MKTLVQKVSESHLTLLSQMTMLKVHRVVGLSLRKQIGNFVV